MGEVIVLTTSNASKKYFTDAFAVLSWPRKWVVHFRYQVQWIDKELVDLLPRTEGALESSTSSLKDKNVLAAYLFQERALDPDTHKPRWEQLALYPFRYGKLVEAHRIGTGKYDTAHFYFQVGGYHSPAPGTAAPNIRVRPGIYASVERFEISESNPADDESAAYTLVEGVQPPHVGYQPNQSDLAEKRRYYPVLCHVRDMRRAGNSSKTLAPRFERTARGSYYELTEKKEYLFDFSFYLPSWCGAPRGGSKITLEYDHEAFATTAKRMLAVESRYDEQAWLLVPASAERQILRELVFSTDLRVPEGINADAADLDLTIPVVIKQDKVRRFWSAAMGLLAAAGLTIGTVAVALLPAAIQNPQAGFPIGLLAVGMGLGYGTWLLIGALSSRPRS